MENKKTNIKCWICKDSGLVFFIKKQYGIEYEYAYRCTCLRGQISSDKIEIVPQVLAENMLLKITKI